MVEQKNATVAKDSFESEFFRHYLGVGIGALSKRDTDALVMYLLDKYGFDAAGPLYRYPNQDLSAKLKAPVAKIKQLRYEAGLKYGGRVEDQAKARFLAAIAVAVFDIEFKKVCLVIEDALAKNWLQGQLKNNGLIFDHSFNNEIVKVDAMGLFALLEQFFDEQATESFREKFERLEKEKKKEQLRDGFAKIAKAFATEAAKKAGGGVAMYFGLSSG